MPSSLFRWFQKTSWCTIFSPFSVDLLPMTKIPFVTLQSPTSLPSQNNSAPRKPRNFWVDKSWRVRYSVADSWVDLAMAIGGDRAGDELVAAFVRLIKDNEAEVRSAIAKQIPGEAQLT